MEGVINRENIDSIKSKIAKLSTVSINTIIYSLLYSGMGIIHSIDKKEISRIEKLTGDEEIKKSLENFVFLKCIYKKGKPVFSPPPPEIAKGGAYMWDYNSFEKEIIPSSQALAILCLAKLSEIKHDYDPKFGSICLYAAERIYDFSSAYLRNEDGFFVSAKDKRKNLKENIYVKKNKKEGKFLEQLYFLEALLYLNYMTEGKRFSYESKNSGLYKREALGILEYIFPMHLDFYKLSSRDISYMISSLERCCNMSNDDSINSSLSYLVASLSAELSSRLDSEGKLKRFADEDFLSSNMSNIRGACALYQGFKETKIERFYDDFKLIMEYILKSNDVMSLFSANEDKVKFKLRDITDLLRALIYSINFSKSSSLNTFDEIYTILERSGIINSVVDREGDILGVKFIFPDNIPCYKVSKTSPVFLKNSCNSIGEEDITPSKDFSSFHSLYSSYIILNELYPLLSIEIKPLKEKVIEKEEVEEVLNYNPE